MENADRLAQELSTMSVIGFTGTRYGMTIDQRRTVCELLTRDGITEVHHGDCVGADADFHQLANGWRHHIVIHPPTDEKLRAFCDGTDVVHHVAKPYLDRNRDIVDACDQLIATPKEDGEPFGKGGGTWYTIRYAREIGKRVAIVYPDGEVGA